MYLPLRDSIRTVRLPVLTIALIVVNCLAFVAWESNDVDTAKATVLYGAVPYELMHSDTQCVPQRNGGTSLCGPTAKMEAKYQVSFPSAWVTIFTSMFLHVGLAHLFGNMLFLGIFGRAVEDALGRTSFLLFYLVGGFAAVLGHTLYDPSSQVQCVGASGAIASVMGAYLVLFPRAKVFSLLIFFPCHPRAVWVIGSWLAEQALLAWLIAGSGATGGVAVFAHFGGFAAGCALTYLVVSGEEIAAQRLRARAFAGDLELSADDPAAALVPSMQPPSNAPQFVTAPSKQPTFTPTGYFTPQVPAQLQQVAPAQAVAAQHSPSVALATDPFAPQPTTAASQSPSS